MNSPPEEEVSIWNTVQELVSLEKDIYRVKVNQRDARNSDKEDWRMEYREHLRSKAAKRQQLLESLEKGLKSCGLDTLRQTRAGTTDRCLSGKDNLKRNDNTWNQQIEKTQEGEPKQVFESSLRERDSVACKLDFETAQGRDKFQKPSKYSTVEDNHVMSEQELQREYIQLKRQCHTLLAENETLEQNCHSLENLIKTQRKHMEYYEEELEQMSKKLYPSPLEEKTNIQRESRDGHEKGIVENASRQFQEISESIQQQMQLKYRLQEQIDSLEEHKEELERTVNHLQTTKEELQDNIRKLESHVQNLEQKKQISLDTLHSMFQQIQTEVSRSIRGKHYVTQLATDVVHTISSYDGDNGMVHQPEATMNTNAITIKAISKLQEKMYSLQDALSHSQEEANRYKKALYALREEHEMTIQRYGKEFQILVQELHRVRVGQRKRNKDHGNRSFLSQLR
ncbi:hypothetical protein Gasu2_57010 [Galdieria sulphuraria]|uniref:Uncharacterized protein n=1 Tax=Galdieria sulphuraria TaxID=130081 RepID=M2X163_GALSU|nr:uncharacterized protein Gasu_24870 [Galdieria sulphuraria]EME30105.1 hypothetical protein Gasu_24870 [Galdieria sulphuraria]GJD11568.1 hypothetical protein Gasu2_57010 [Galdieria sulphuraria]|eukprot:XP_005706625.1 hypothetical protein Gasu_24870 [Galdieria sulphuraria]